MKQECLKIRAFKGTLMFIQLWSGLHPFILYHFIPHPSSHQAMTEYVGSTSQDHTYCTATGGSTAGEYPRELDTHMGRKCKLQNDHQSRISSRQWFPCSTAKALTIQPWQWAHHRSFCTKILAIVLLLIYRWVTSCHENVKPVNESFKSTGFNKLLLSLWGISLKQGCQTYSLRA